MRVTRVTLLVFLSAALACGGDDGDGGNVDGGGNNAAPVASFTMTPDCTTSNTTPVTFTSTSTDGDGDTITCSWMFSSGNPSTSTNCTATGVTFPNLAPYQILLMISDGNGGSDSQSMTLDPC